MSKRTFKSLDGLRRFVESHGGSDAWSVGVLHDDGCSTHHIEPTATCKPHYTAERATVENLIEGVRKEAAWEKKNAN